MLPGACAAPALMKQTRGTLALRSPHPLPSLLPMETRYESALACLPFLRLSTWQLNQLASAPPTLGQTRPRKSHPRLLRTRTWRPELSAPAPAPVSSELTRRPDRLGSRGSKSSYRSICNSHSCFGNCHSRSSHSSPSNSHSRSSHSSHSSRSSSPARFVAWPAPPRHMLLLGPAAPTKATLGGPSNPDLDMSPL